MIEYLKAVVDTLLLIALFTVPFFAGYILGKFVEREKK